MTHYTLPTHSIAHVLFLFFPTKRGEFQMVVHFFFIQP